jgi:catalase
MELTAAIYATSPVNCPFMSKYHSPDNFNGSMRIDANHGGKPQYYPNSYMTTNNSSMTKRRAPGFDPSTAEAPFQVANNVVSRQSYYKHEGDASEYTQVRELYQVGRLCIYALMITC